MANHFLVRVRPRHGVVLLVAAGVALSTAAANGEGKARRAAPEVAVGGLTREQVAQRQAALRSALTAELPERAGENSVRVELTDEDRGKLAQPYESGKPLRIGVVKPIADAVGIVGGNPGNRGVTGTTGAGENVWAVTVTSPGAQAIRVKFSDFSLPPGAEAYFYSVDAQADGPYTGTGRNGTGEFWSRSISGDTGIVQVRFGEGQRGNVSLRISDIAHISGRQAGKKPKPEPQTHDAWPCSDNAPCLVDVNCVDTGPAAPAEDAVAKMEWIQGPFVNTCTGGLLADTDAGSQIPYFLTANHCTNSSISNLETFFFYRTDSCNGTCPDSLVTGGDPPPADTVGFTVLETNSQSDFTLGTLDEAPPAGVVFLGWNSSPVAFTNAAQLYRISNANFGPQVYSQHQVDTGSPVCTGLARGDFIYSDTNTGGTMGGSSGSPVVNSASEVVGQLFGCCGFDCADNCASAPTNWTVDGAFAVTFPQVEHLLDPTPGCSTDPECDDGLFCTGTETCVGGTCQSSGDPCAAGETCNEATDSCDPAACDNDGVCEAGEDCNNCPNDCGSKTSGNPNSRFCCDGDLPDCGDSRCNEGGFVCGGSTCTTDADCDDGQFCNGAETCSGGVCQAGSDPCPGQGCDEATDQCVACGGNKAPCNSNADCCSGNCKNGQCKGN